jgi:NAD(P)-dependent dehydrogenase (short-subunit alcohol dehydrogenase family)
MTPLRRIGMPEEIAEAAAWLISPAASCHRQRGDCSGGRWAGRKGNGSDDNLQNQKSD